MLYTNYKYWKNLLNSFTIFSLMLIGFASCNIQKNDKNQQTENTKEEYFFPYDLGNPDTLYNLPEYLNEISGISCYKKNKIACVQDEQAIIYIYDTEKGKVTSKIDFGKNDDFEDIAIEGDNAYVLKSNGTIYKVKNFDKKGKRKTIKFETPLKVKNNTEGMYFDKGTNSLLIACKNSPSINKKELYEGYKAIYRFDLNIKKLIKKPAYLIDLSITEKFKYTGTIEKISLEAAKKLKLIGDDNSFHPSGIAIHPFDNDKIYIISDIGKLLIIMNKQGSIIDIHELNRWVFNQPEGICFSENGDLFISNENKNGNANILRYKHIKIK